MATLVLVASLWFSWWSFTRKRALARQNRSETLPAKFFGHLFELSASLGAVLLFYHLLLGLVASGWQWVTAADLERLEEWLVNTQRTLDRYKPEWATWMIVLIVLYLLGRLWIRFLERDTPFRVFRKVKDLLHVLNTVVFLLASFTLLGFQPGKAAATLEIHLRQERKEYGVLRREIRTAVAGVTINRAYDHAVKVSPQAGAAPNLVNDSVTEGANLRSIYADARTKYAIRDDKIDALIKRTEIQAQSLERASRREASGDDAGVRSDDIPRLPETASYARIRKARRSVEAFTKRFHPEVLRLLSEPGGKEIVLELPDGPIDHLAEMLGPIAEAFPIFKPVFDVVQSTLSDAVELALGRKIDDLTRSAVEHPQNVETEIPSAAKDLIDAAPTKVRSGAVRRFRLGVESLRREVNEIRQSSDQLQQAMQTEEARRTSLPEPSGPGEVYAKSDQDAPPPSVEVPDNGPANVPIGSPPNNQTETPGERAPTLEPVEGQCTCEEYVNGALVASFPIPIGASCGPYVCGHR